MNTQTMNIAIVTDSESEITEMTRLMPPDPQMLGAQSFTAVKMVGVWAEDPEVRSTYAKVAHLREYDYEELKSDKNVQIILNYMCGPEKDNVTREMLKAGKHVLPLKMCAYTLENAKEFAAIAKEKNVIFASTTDCYLSASMQTVRYLMDKGIIGTPESCVVSMTRNHFSLGWSTPFLLGPNYDVFKNMSNWYIFPLIALFGPIKRVFAIGTKAEKEYTNHKPNSLYFGEKYENIDSHDVVTSVLEFESGFKATFHMNGKTSGKQNYVFNVYGDEGMFILSHPHDFNAPVKVQKDYSDEVNIPFTHGFLHQYEDLCAAEVAWSVINKRPSRINSDISVHAVDVIESIKNSMASGKPVELTTTCERPAPLKPGCIAGSVGIGDFWTIGEETALAL